MMPNNPVPNYAGAYPPPPPPFTAKPSTGRLVLKWLLALFVASIAAVLGLLVLLMIASETGLAALLAAMFVATLPVPLYIILILWIDRYESEPLWMLAMAFFWGATIAVFIAYLINTIGGYYVAHLTQSIIIAKLYGAVISAPIVEESAKAMMLFLLFFWKKDEFDGVVDGFVYAGMIGLGFAMTENFQYYGNVINEARGIHNPEFHQIYFLRGMLAPYSHPLFTSMTGIGLGAARQSRHTALKVILPILGLGLAMFLHFLWNFSAVVAGVSAASQEDAFWNFIWIYLVVMVPIFCIIIGVILFALRREGRVVRENLLCDFQRGLLTQEEYNRLCSIRGRIGSSTRALARGGFGRWRARMRFNQIASELAFHRSRVARGFHSREQSDAEREAAYIQTLQELRQRLGQY
jgi:RsiW-degrading membrane proteinase PrsW (M82 family)